MSRSSPALAAGVPCGVGSLPHQDPAEAARLVTTLHRRLPAAPQLPGRSPAEGMLAQWLMALPEVEVLPDGGIRLTGALGDVDPRFDGDAHGGLLAFVDHVAGQDHQPSGVKVQLTGPLTLGLALVAAGMNPELAFPRAAELVGAWADALVALLARRLSNSAPVVFVDEPSLVEWRTGEPPLAREDGVDLLSGVLAGIDAVTGVHVCGDGERRMAIEAGPDIVGFPVSESVLGEGVALSRYLEGGGWIAWGAIPTDRPVGDQADHWWRSLVGLWCDLTAAGCDPVLLRTQSMITPACGLAGHSESQAERILALAVEIGERVREQAVATRLSVGA